MRSGPRSCSAPPTALQVAIGVNPPTGQLGRRPARHPEPAVRRPAVHRDDHRARGLHRALRGAGRRRPAVLERGPDLTAEERRRAREVLDLQEGRGPVALLDDAGIGELLRDGAADRGRGRVGGPWPAVVRRLPDARGGGLRLRADQPEHGDGPRRPRLPDDRRGRRGDGPVRYRRRLPALRAVRPPRRGGRGRRARGCLWLQLGVVNWEAARIAAAAGLSVVMDRCTAIELRRIRR